MTTLSAQAHDCPMPFALLKVADSKAGKLVVTESAREQQGRQRPIAFALDLLPVWCLPNCLA